MDQCIFCGISNKNIPTDLIYEDNEIAAFNDIHPKAPIHILIVPKKHIASVAELKDDDGVLVGKMILVAKKLAEEKGIAENGYRLVFNTKKHAGQVVDHIHLHLLGGKVLGPMA